MILREGQVLDDLDLWPGDRVLYGADFTLIGIVNGHGQFVSFLQNLH